MLGSCLLPLLVLIQFVALNVAQQSYYDSHYYYHNYPYNADYHRQYYEWYQRRYGSRSQSANPFDMSWLFPGGSGAGSTEATTTAAPSTPATDPFGFNALNSQFSSFFGKK